VAHRDERSSTLDRPWHRPGAARYALTRIRRALRPPVRVEQVPPGEVDIRPDLPVTARDGTVLRVNVYLPPGGGRHPVILCAHPYGKDRLPQRRRRGYRVAMQYRLLRQPSPVRFSELTTWEAPDPLWWTGQGYAVVNADLRGCGASEGTGDLMGAQEGRDVADLIEWAAAQPWSTGKVGMLGVSYLAISQYRAAGEHPAGLAAICPWEGLTDPYRDLMRPGGIREDGFMAIWTRQLRQDRLSFDIRARQREHQLRDSWWESVTPDLSGIQVPMLVCGSFSDHCLHTRGSFRAFAEVFSEHRYLYTHRAGKWAEFYSAEARMEQRRFLDRFVADRPAASEPPRVRLEVRDSRDQVVSVRDEAGWPPPGVRWTELFLGSDGALAHTPPPDAGSVTFPLRRRAAAFRWTVDADCEIVGPMALRLFVQAVGCDDVPLFVGVEKWRAGRYVPFEGSYGFGRDRVATGWLRASLRELAEGSSPQQPAHTFARRQALSPGEVVEVQVPLLPSATAFRAGDELRLVVAGRWLSPRNPLTGQFPTRYERPPKGAGILHWGPDRPARLLLPVLSS
jgi:predicted acyl esterase